MFVYLYEDELYISPNDICVFKDGSFWITNDAGKRNSTFERMLKLKRSTIIHTDLHGNAKIAADNLAYANGITYKENKLYVSTTMQGKVFIYDIGEGNLNNRKILAEVKGGDNLTWYGDDLLVTSHQKFLAFIKHVKNSDKKSPSVVYRINPGSGEKKLLYSDEGDEISAASTAIMYDNNLYISQVFDPFILKVEMK